MRYGKDVTVGSSADDLSVHGNFYPTLTRLNVLEPSMGSEANQVAGLRDHTLSLVYYF